MYGRSKANTELIKKLKAIAKMNQNKDFKTIHVIFKKKRKKT